MGCNSRIVSRTDVTVDTRAGAPEFGRLSSDLLSGLFSLFRQLLQLIRVSRKLASNSIKGHLTAFLICTPFPHHLT